MGIRENLDRKKGLALGLAAVAVVSSIAIAFIGWRGGRPPASKSQAYYTTDDGATYFPDAIDKVVPFEHNGSAAHRAYVYQCKDGKPFVAYLQRLTDTGKTRLAALLPRASDPLVAGQIIEVQSQEAEVKKTGAGEAWVAANSERAANVTSVKCTDGSSDSIVVLP